MRVVSNLSALLYVRREHRFSVNEDHTNMVKFMSRVDSTYLTVVLHMKKSVDQYLNSCCKCCRVGGVGGVMIEPESTC